MWIERKIQSLLKEIFHQFPAILITGLRQTGKTSLLQRLFPKAEYTTLDLPANQIAAQKNPMQFIESRKAPLIIDEIQYSPELFKALKIAIDTTKMKGLFLLTGSQSFHLMQGISESLAGRCAILQLHPLSLSEIQPYFAISDAEIILRGGFPELYATKKNYDVWYSSYISTYLERDVRNVLNVSDLRDFNLFMRACALRITGLLSYSDLARDIGISVNTAKKWISVLATLGAVHLVEPYFSNRTKRLIKAPKLYFADTGLCAFLCGFSSPQQLRNSPMAGYFFENFVYTEIVKHYSFTGKRCDLYHWRDTHGKEVDFLLEAPGGKIIPIECKLTETPNAKDIKNIYSLFDYYGKEKIDRCYVVCRTKEMYEIEKKIYVTDIKGLLKHLR